MYVTPIGKMARLSIKKIVRPLTLTFQYDQQCNLVSPLDVVTQNDGAKYCIHQQLGYIILSKER